MSSTPDYGLDAPAFPFVATGLGSCLLVLGAFSWVTAWPDDGTLRHAVWPGLIALSYAAMHLWVSKVGKLRRAVRLLDSFPWQGHERVLDVGCGRGLLLIGAAKRLTTGRASSVDIWQQKDQWRNSSDKTLDNARRESVLNRPGSRGQVSQWLWRVMPIERRGSPRLRRRVAVDPVSRTRGLGDHAASRSFSNSAGVR